MIVLSGLTTAMSALVFASLAGFATPTGSHFNELALLLRGLVGTFQLLVGIAGLGGLVSFVSH
jgi:SulP family sulfate permease